MSSNSTICNSEDIIKIEARDLGNDVGFGELQEVGIEYIVTQDGLVDQDKYYIPKNLVNRFETGILSFSVTNEEAKQYKEHETNLI
jgi:hypothetical protein